MKRKLDTFEIVMALVVVGALAFILFGRGGSSQGVVLFNMDLAYRELGRDKTLMEEIKNEEVALNKNLEGLRAELENQILEKKKEFGDNPNDEQQKQLMDLERQLASKVQQEAEKNRQLIQQLFREAISRFRQEVRPVADQIAAKHNASVVLNLTAEQVITFDFSADITNEVVEALKQGTQLPVSGN